MELKEYLEVIVEWLKTKIVTTKTKGYVLGVSGGIDSAVVALLAKKAVGNNLHCLILPCQSAKKDHDDAVKLLEENGINYTVIDLELSYLAMVKALTNDSVISKEAMLNIKVRLRMICLYAFAQTKKYLVLGTDNFAEYFTGYFTKYGDGGVDVQPIVHLLKREVYQAAKILGVPQEIIARKPSAGLFDNQSDEDDLGVTYDILDDYLLGKEVSKDAEERIISLNIQSQHKRELLPSPPAFKRGNDK